MRKKSKKVVKAIQKKAKQREQKVQNDARKAEEKKNNKILKLVKGEFQSLGEEKVESIAKSVVVNENVMKRDAESLKKWQEEYYNVLFGKIKTLIIEHNEKMLFDSNKLSDDIDKKRKTIKELKQEKSMLREQIKSLRIEKGILVDA